VRVGLFVLLDGIFKGCVGLFGVCRPLVSVCRPLLSVCRSLLSVCQPFLSVCRPPLKMYWLLWSLIWPLLSAFRALLSVCRLKMYANVYNYLAVCELGLFRGYNMALLLTCRAIWRVCRSVYNFETCATGARLQQCCAGMCVRVYVCT